MVRIRGGDVALGQMAPAAVADIIKAKNLFGGHPNQEMSSI
jgi:hypothetical protein